MGFLLRHSHRPAQGLSLGLWGAAALMSLNCHNSIKPCSGVQPGNQPIRHQPRADSGHNTFKHGHGLSFKPLSPLRKAFAAEVTRPQVLLLFPRAQAGGRLGRWAAQQA